MKQALEFKEYLKFNRNECDNYIATVHAILAFAAFVIKDNLPDSEDSHFGIGRKMLTSPKNIKNPESEIHPDLVIQKNNQYGIVTEVKGTLSNNETYWQQHIDQLRKYDDELKGWWTNNKKIKNSDVALLLHLTKVRKFVKYLENRLQKNPDLIGSNTSIVEFVRNLQSEVFIYFRIEWGNINDPNLKEKLDTGVSIPLYDIIKKFSSVKYYDTPPPLPWLLSELWNDVFFTASMEVEYDEINKYFPLEVKVSSLTEELQLAYGYKSLENDENSVEFPKKKWIRHALDMLVKLKLAKFENQNKYLIFYRKFRQDIDILDKFIYMIYDISEPTNAYTEVTQTEMFNV